MDPLDLARPDLAPLAPLEVVLAARDLALRGLAPWDLDAVPHQGKFNSLLSLPRSLTSPGQRVLGPHSAAARPTPVALPARTLPVVYLLAVYVRALLAALHLGLV